MDKQTAINIIRNTFQNPFDKEQFVYFTKNLLNSIDESKAFWSETAKAIEKFLFTPIVAINKNKKINAKWKVPGPWA